MMTRFQRFGQIFWGFPFLMLELPFHGFDLLPDSIGCILIAVGCRGLVVVSKQFRMAQACSWTLCVLSLVGYVVPKHLALPYSLLFLAVECATVWFVLGGVMEFTSARQREDLSLRASDRRVACVILIGVGVIGGIVAHGAGDLAAIMMAVGVICMVSALALIMHMLHRVRHELTVAFLV